MGAYVLYLLMQAFVALIFAYFSGTLLFRQRKLYMLMVCVGFYLLMGSGLMEVWGDKAGWTEWAIGANAALVATGVAAFGAGALLREAGRMKDPEPIESISKVFIGISAVMGVVLATAGGSSDAIVDPDGVASAAISGTFSHLGAVGWVLGSPLFIGALLLSWLGVWSIMSRKDIKGFWLVGAGVLFLLWPFDVWFNDLPISPAIILMATAMTFFGFQLPREGEDDVDEDGQKNGKKGDGDPGDEDPAPWVKEVIAAHKAEKAIDPDDGDGDPEDGDEVSSNGDEISNDGGEDPEDERVSKEPTEE